MTDSTGTHLAELRAQARAAGIERFRMLRKEDLASELRNRGVEIAEPLPEPAPRRARREDEPRRRAEKEEETRTHPIEGILDVTPRGHGFLRSAGLQAGEDDVYVSASQIRRCALRPGDVVDGPAREPRRDERYTALVHVDQVNGTEPSDERPSFDKLTPARPDRALGLDLSGLDSGDRDLISAHPELTEAQAGQRILVRAEPGVARFALLRALARALAVEHGRDVIVLLIDLPPEDVAEWQDGAGDATVATLPADASPAAAGRVARLALEHAKRKAESGRDAVLIVDSLSRLAVFEDDIAGVKRLFGAGRRLSEDGAGSLTVIATTLGEDAADRAVATTESALVTLSG
jgi:transcription termination factor Rho